MATKTFDIDDMPRGGPDASWLDRRLQTDRLEYLDREDVNDLKRRVIHSLDRCGWIFGTHKRFARMALANVAHLPNPKILELGAGHGGLSRALLKMHPTAHVTVTDLESTSVAALAAGDLGRHPRALVRMMDATAIDVPNAHYDLAVFALSFHHLPPLLAARAFAEGTRVAQNLLIIDIRRPMPLLHILELAIGLPLGMLVPVLHDGCISSLRAYSPSALRTLAEYADPAITLELRGGAFRPQVALASRSRRGQ